ncbi:cytochrome P450 2G1-like [Elysia marginata]|uniref:Cytochrome P450 2G1-like n=1 Tax=Elysia marginata TaxID=1093978 RepID=A0AAV4JBK8_9GAST|nr:cytochrome P450 2G1-like [Elysia marginata]
MQAYFNTLTTKFKRRPSTTLPIILNEELSQAFPQMKLKTTKDLQNLQSLAQDRGNWKSLTGRITEFARASTPFGIPHGVDRTFELAGYTIPSDALVFANISAIHNDPANFPNPDKFDPTRWLDKNGDVTGRDRLLSFSLGPRSCLGEILAKMELMMFFTSVLQFYTVQTQHVDLTPVLGFVSKAKDQPIMFKKR